MNTLNSISQITGGKAFLATDAQSLKLIYGEIDKLEPTTFKVKRHTLYSERAGIFMFPAMCIMLVCLLLSSTILGRLP
jgi:Ca-activated chloride channel family protein